MPSGVGKQILNVSQRQREADVHDDRQPDDLGMTLAAQIGVVTIFRDVAFELVPETLGLASVQRH